MIFQLTILHLEKKLNIHQYLMVKKIYKRIIDFFGKLFIRLLPSIVNVSNYSKRVSLSNQKYTTQPTVINLHPNNNNILTDYGIIHL